MKPATPVTATFRDISGIRTAELMLFPTTGAPSAPTAPLLMLHGWGASLKLMQPLAEKMAALGFSVYSFDFPGFGESDPPPVAWSVADYAKFVSAYMDAHDFTRVSLFGHSFGGRVSLILGADYASRISKIALADAAGVPEKKSGVADMRLTTYKAIRDGLYSVGAKGIADKLRGWYNARYGSTDFRAASGVMRQTFVKVVNEDLRPYAKRIQASTLLFWGDKDEDTPLWQGRELESLIPDAGLIVYEGAGHYSYLERLAETAKTLDYFLKQEN